MTSRRAARSAATTDPYLTVPFTARLLGRSRQTIYAMLARGELLGEHIAGRQVVRRDSLPIEAKLRLSNKEAYAR